MWADVTGDGRGGWRRGVGGGGRAEGVAVHRDATPLIPRLGYGGRCEWVHLPVTYMQVAGGGR